MTGKCKSCKHRLQHPHHDSIGICANAESHHAGFCVGDSLKCAHHELERISQIKRHDTFEELIRAGMNRKMRVM